MGSLAGFAVGSVVCLIGKVLALTIVNIWNRG